MPIPPIQFKDKLAYNISAKDYAKVVNKAAQRSENFAWDLISEGIRGNAKAKDIIKITNNDVSGMYEETGELTPKGIKEMTNFLMHTFNLKTEEEAKKITVKQLINKFVQNSK